MKTVLLILIFSSIAGIAGYYYGRTSALEEPSSKPTEATVVTPDEKEAPAEPTSAEPTSTEPKEKSSFGGKEIVATLEQDFAARSARPTHTLTDTKGRIIEAKILSVDGDQVKVRRTDGLETTFPITMLIPEDIAFCEYLRKESSFEQKAASSDQTTWEDIFGK